ncbi:MAG: hypothetical protein Q9208_002707 [Pyrenodesmia sp. 3 TL-2023]
MADSTPKSYHTDPNLYLYTSLTAGSSHIITATSRLETILKANRIPFQALDVATDEKARMLWGRRAGKRKLPGLVRMGMLVGDLEEVEEWNEYGELKEKVGVPARSSTPSAANTPTKVPQSTSTPSKLSTAVNTAAQLSSTESPSKTKSSAQTESPMAAAMRQAGMEAAKKAGDVKAKASAQAGVNSKLPSETQSKLVDPGATKSGDATSNAAPSGGESTTMKPGEAASTKESNLAPGDEIYAGQGDKDPDKEAVVPDTEEEIHVRDFAESSAQDVKSGDPDQEAVVPGSGHRIDVEGSAMNDTDGDRTKHPDAEAVAPGSKDTIGAGGKGLPDRGVPNKGSDEVDDGVNADARGRNTIENTTNATASSGDAVHLPGKRTQDQTPAKADEAGASVAD